MVVVTHGSGAGVAWFHRTWLQDENGDKEAKLFLVRFSSHPTSCKGSWDPRVFPVGDGSRSALGPGLWVGGRGSRWDAAGATTQGDTVMPQPYLLHRCRAMDRICAGAQCCVLHPTTCKSDAWDFGDVSSPPWCCRTCPGPVFLLGVATGCWRGRGQSISPLGQRAWQQDWDQSGLSASRSCLHTAARAELCLRLSPGQTQPTMGWHSLPGRSYSDLQG